ncbi:MAG TPA: AAA family ATPase [Chitinophagaceae bacterium]|jgi:hypothetical protein|nr:AAA family ATPase [Chitinophagaceae bacterium]
MDNRSAAARLQHWLLLLKHKMKRPPKRERWKEVPAIPFGSNYMDAKTYFLKRFGEIPCIVEVYEVDIRRIYDYLEEHYRGRVTDCMQLSEYNREKKEIRFEHVLWVLAKGLVVKLACQYAEILYCRNMAAEAHALAAVLDGFPAEPKEQPHEINIISTGSYGLGLKPLEIRQTELDIGLYYNDDFAPVDAVIRERLARTDDKGIVLLHGLPGTGKTTYLRYLIGSLRKKVLFVSPMVAGNLMNPEFIDLLIDHPNAVLVIEDAESILMDRKLNSASTVSNLLNISDGLLSDCLNVQVICTFNSTLSAIDEALMRKGRLIARYEFGRLTVEKGRQLAAHLQLPTEVNRPLTLAELTHPEERNYSAPSIEVVGFRRAFSEA